MGFDGCGGWVSGVAKEEGARLRLEGLPCRHLFLVVARALLLVAGLHVLLRGRRRGLRFFLWVGQAGGWGVSEDRGWGRVGVGVVLWGRKHAFLIGGITKGSSSSWSLTSSDGAASGNCGWGRLEGWGWGRLEGGVGWWCGCLVAVGFNPPRGKREHTFLFDVEVGGGLTGNGNSSLVLRLWSDWFFSLSI